jgi:hypothetical protein
MKTSIQHICHISQQTISLDGKVIFHLENQVESNEFLNESYRFLQIDYPKFFKMDILAKVAFIATELISKSLISKDINKDAVGIVLGNKSSSLIADLTHQRSIQDKNAHFPSPAVFVYTLPNIMMGEMCIRHGFSNENTLFISKEFDAETLSKYTNHLFNERIIEYCIGGWADAQPGNYEAFLYFVGTGKSTFWGEHTAENIQYLKQKSDREITENLHKTAFEPETISSEY